MPWFDRFLLVLVVLIPWQIYLPLYGDKNITLFSLLSCVGFLWWGARAFSRDRLSAVLRALPGYIWAYGAFWLLICFAFMHTPDKADGAKYVLYLFLGMPLFLMLSERSPSLTRNMLVRAFLWSSLPMAFLTIGVFLFKEHQYAFYRLPFLGIFVEPDTLAALLADPYFCNILEPGRAGGLFINAQEGALYAGGCILLSLWQWRSTGALRYLCIALIWVIALLAFGTLVGVLAAAASLMAIGMLMALRAHVRIVPVITVLAVLLSLFALLLHFHPRLKRYETFDSSFNGRTRIWRASVSAIRQHWVLGVGLDGVSWDKAYAAPAERFNAVPKTSPHNMFLTIWAKAGLGAVVAIMLFLLLAFVSSARQYIMERDQYALVAAGLLAWLFVEAMSENFLIMGLHVAGILWFVLAVRER